MYASDVIGRHAHDSLPRAEMSVFQSLVVEHVLLIRETTNLEPCGMEIDHSSL